MTLFLTSFLDPCRGGLYLKTYNYSQLLFVRGVLQGARNTCQKTRFPDAEFPGGRFDFLALLAYLLGRSFFVLLVDVSGLFGTLWGSSVGGVCGVWVQK